MFQAKKITRPFWLPENYEHVLRELKHTHIDKFCDVFILKFFSVLLKFINLVLIKLARSR